MLLRLLALGTLGTLGYVAYRYLEKSGALSVELTGPDATSSASPDIPLAGGPLSSQATLQHSADEPPAAAPVTHLPA